MPTTKKRHICIYCGSKRTEDKMIAVGEKHGRYFQAGKEITGYVCIYREYISSPNCYEKYEKDKKYSPYHDIVRVGDQNHKVGSSTSK